MVLDSPLIPVFLGIIAVTALLHAVFLAGATFAIWKGLSYLGAVSSRAETEITKLGQKLDKLTAQVETLSRQAHETMARTEPMVDSAASRAWRTGHSVRRMVETPQTTLQKGTAILNGVLRAVETYRQFRGPAAR